MKHEFLSQQCTQFKSRVQLHSSGCTKQMEKLVFGRLIKNAKSGSVWMVHAGLLCPCSELMELLPDCLGAELS